MRLFFKQSLQKVTIPCYYTSIAYAGDNKVLRNNWPQRGALEPLQERAGDKGIWALPLHTGLPWDL